MLFGVHRLLRPIACLTTMSPTLHQASYGFLDTFQRGAEIGVSDRHIVVMIGHTMAAVSFSFSAPEIQERMRHTRAGRQRSKEIGIVISTGNDLEDTGTVGQKHKTRLLRAVRCYEYIDLCGQELYLGLKIRSFQEVLGDGFVVVVVVMVVVLYRVSELLGTDKFAAVPTIQNDNAWFLFPTGICCIGSAVLLERQSIQNLVAKVFHVLYRCDLKGHVLGRMQGTNNRTGHVTATGVVGFVVGSFLLGSVAVTSTAAAEFQLDVEIGQQFHQARREGSDHGASIMVAFLWLIGKDGTVVGIVVPKTQTPKELLHEMW